MRKNLALLWSYARGRGTALTAVAATSLMASLLALCQPYFMQGLLGSVESGRELTKTIVIIVSLVLASAVLSALQGYLLQSIGEAVTFASRKELISHIIRLPISEFDTRESGDFVSRVAVDTSRLKACLVQAAVALTSSIFTTIGAVILMARVSPELTAVAFAATATALGISLLLTKFIRKAAITVQQTLAALSSFVVRSVMSIRTVRAANATRRLGQEGEDTAEACREAGLKLARTQMWVAPISNVAVQSCSLLILGFGGYRVSTGQMTVATLVAFMLLLFMMTSPIQQIISAFSAVGESSGSLARLEDTLEIPVELELPIDDQTTTPLIQTGDSVKVVASSGSAIEFSDVSFAYNNLPAPETSGADALHGVSLTIRTGQRTAIVGPSGAGKSTILQLIERFYDPTDGQIDLFGVDLRDLSRQEVRARLAYVEQDSPAFSGTLRDNLHVSDPLASDERLAEVLDDVGLRELRSRQGLDLPVGEGGSALSGGERQRLAIARALLSGADIVLLDEATANLDGLSEDLIRGVIDRVFAGKTIVSVAHRLSTIIDYDTIYLLEHGRIVASGTHADLFASSPLYRALATEQRLTATAVNSTKSKSR